MSETHGSRKPRTFELRVGFDIPGVFTAAVAHAAEYDAGPQKAIDDVRYLEEQLYWICCGLQQNGPLFADDEIRELYERAQHDPYHELRSLVEERYRAFTVICDVCGLAAKLPQFTT